MTRILVTAWLSLLFLGMQQQLVVHDVDHLRAKVQHGRYATLANPAAAECLECALLAGGANAAPAADLPPSHNAHAATPVADSRTTPRRRSPRPDGQEREADRRTSPAAARASARVNDNSA